MEGGIMPELLDIYPWDKVGQIWKGARAGDSREKNVNRALS